MKILSKMDSLDNVQDGSTRKLITKTTSSGTGNVVSSVSVSGDTITYTKGVNALTAHQNAFSTVKVGSTNVAADQAGDTLELVAGSNVTLTPDATNDKVTIAATDTTYESKAAASGGTAVSLVTTGEKYTWNNKQNALSTQTAYSAKGTTTKVPQITTNTLGQVTKIEEVTITQPTVNNGTLTIQKNGTNVQTFSANQSGNATANITVPTKTSELTNDSGYTTNTGTITGVSVNGSSVATSGVANITNVPTNILTEPRFQSSATVTNRTLFHTVRANRLAFLPADQVIVEKSTDAGTTWEDAGWSDATKRSLFTGLNNGGGNIPQKNGQKSTDCMLRITISAMKYTVPEGTTETNKYNYWTASNVKSQERYCTLQTMYFWMNAGADRIWLKVERATGANPNNWTNIFDSSSNANRVGLTGWSGMDFITFSPSTFGGGTTQTGNHWNYRLTFRTCTSDNSSEANLFNDSKLSANYITQAQGVSGICGYGDNCWGSPNSLMSRDHLYSWDADQNAIFPASIITPKNDNMGIIPNTHNYGQIGSSSKYFYRSYVTNYYGDKSFINNWASGKNIGAPATSSAAATKGTVNFINDCAAGETQTKTLLSANTTTSNITVTLPNQTGTLALTSEIPTAVSQLTNDSGYTSNTGTITKVQANGTDIASSGTANIPAATTSRYGVTELSNATNSTSEVLAATPKAVKAAYDLAASKGTGTITGISVNGTSVATSGTANITSVPASILTGAIPSAVTATTQSQGNNSTKIATTAYVDTAISNLPEPMKFKGTLGTGGTVTSLPTTGVKVGDTYKVITAGTYASQAAKVGDMFIASATTPTWEYVPSGDDGNGTVTSVTIKATSPIAIDSSSAITTSGERTISHANSGVTAGTYRSITVNATGHVTAGTNPTTLSGYGITDAKIASGVITLGSNTITPLTSSSTLDATKLSGTIPSGCYTDTKYTAGTGLTLDGTQFKVTSANVSTMINLLDTGSSELTANDYVITQYVNGGTTTTSYHRRPANKVVNATLVKAALGTDGSTTTQFLSKAGSWQSVSTTDTKNTAGATDTSSKIFLIGATSQAANPQTYSDNEVYATSGVLTTKSVQVGGTAATMQYNSTDKCIEFVFA